MAAEVVDPGIRKIARRVIDAVINSPCVVEVRMFSQPEAVEKLENEVAALISPAIAAGEYYCPKHKYNPPPNSGIALCPQCEIIAGNWGRE